MRILHLAPLWFPVSRDALGGIETFLAGLIEVLENLGCRNTLIASGDSRTRAELVPAVPRNLYDAMAAGDAVEYVHHEQHQLMTALQRATDADLVHSHIGSGGYVLSGVPGLGERVLHTIHTPIYRDHERFIAAHPELWLSTVSDFQARKLRAQGATRCHVIHNGISVETFPFQPHAAQRLVFVGRMEATKGPDVAVRTACAVGMPLTLAGPIVDDDFFKRAVEPYLGADIQYAGVVDHRGKAELLGQAGCVLMPSRVQESWGLVSVEAMACGTPVVALANGALPEIIESGLTGYVTPHEEALPGLVNEALRLDRAAIRARAVARFGLREVAQSYCRLYSQIAGAAGRGGPRAEE